MVDDPRSTTVPCGFHTYRQQQTNCSWSAFIIKRRLTVKADFGRHL